MTCKRGQTWLCRSSVVYYTTLKKTPLQGKNNDWICYLLRVRTRCPLAGEKRGRWYVHRDRSVLPVGSFLRVGWAVSSRGTFLGIVTIHPLTSFCHAVRFIPWKRNPLNRSMSKSANVVLIFTVWKAPVLRGFLTKSVQLLARLAEASTMANEELGFTDSALYVEMLRACLLYTSDAADE